MKKYILPAIIIGLLVANLNLQVSNATSGTPGTATDPVVTKSYVDEQIALALSNSGTNTGNTNSNNTGSNTGTVSTGLTQSQLDALTTRIYNDVVAKTSEITPLHKPVKATKGQTILGAEGTEIILRSGECVIYSVVENGVTNLTYGTNLDNGEAVAKDNLLIVPRQDGRGVTVTTDEAWFMIRGEYEIIG